MKPLSLKVRLVLVGITVCGVALAVSARYSGICRLQAVTLNGAAVADWPQSLPSLRAASVINQPLDRVARHVLARQDVYKVDVSVAGLHTVAITTNEFSPTCFVVDEHSGRLLALDNTGRIVPLPREVDSWEHPVLTNCGVSRVFRRCDDSRVPVVLNQLARLRERNCDLYRLVEEVSFEEKTGVTVSISGVRHRLSVSPDRFAERLQDYADFVLRYHPDLSQVHTIDLGCDNMIICRVSEPDSSGTQEADDAR